MKSVVSAIVYLSISGGSMIIFVISSIQIFDSQVYEILFYTLLMSVTTIIFTCLAIKYKYNADTQEQS